MTNPTNPGHDTTDPRHGAYQSALARYTDAAHYADRAENLQLGEPLERQDPLVWRAQENAWRALGQARSALIATAPDQPTSWWPGGWSAVSTHWPYGLRGRVGQVARTNIWRTQDDARAGRPDFIPADDWTVSWTPAGRDEFRRDIALDATFWAANEATASS